MLSTLYHIFFFFFLMARDPLNKEKRNQIGIGLDVSLLKLLEFFWNLDYIKSLQNLLPIILNRAKSSQEGY